MILDCIDYKDGQMHFKHKPNKNLNGMVKIY